MNTKNSLGSVLYIASSNRSGSTVLDLLLGSQKHIISIGELRHLNKYCTKDLLCTCGSRISSCKFWQEVQRELLKSGFSIYNLSTKFSTEQIANFFYIRLIEIFLIFVNGQMIRLLAKISRVFAELFKIALNCWIIIDAICLVTNTPVVVDSSKRSLKFKLLYLTRPQKFKMIYLTRDGRGVVFSILKRKNWSASKASFYWVVDNIRCYLLMQNIPRNKRLKVRYEDFCTAPSEELDRICKFIGIPCDIKATVLSKDGRHNIGGSLDMFNKFESEIKLDDKWKSSLTRRQLAEFRLIAGLMNRLLGYPSL